MLTDGGHYVPAISAYIHKENLRLRQRPASVAAAAAAAATTAAAPAQVLNLKGMAIGDGWIDPVHMVPQYPAMIYNLGLCSERERAVIQDYCDRTTALIQQGQMKAAFDVWDQFLNGDVWPYGNYFHNITGLNDYDNYLNTNAPPEFDYYAPYLNQPEVRTALHVGDARFPSDPSTCEKHLLADFMVSFVDELVTMLESTEPAYKVLIYSGQLGALPARGTACRPSQPLASEALMRRERCSCCAWARPTPPRGLGARNLTPAQMSSSAPPSPRLSSPSCHGAGRRRTRRCPRPCGGSTLRTLRSPATRARWATSRSWSCVRRATSCPETSPSAPST